MIAHPDIHIPPETYVLPSIIKTFHTFNGASWQDLVALSLSKFYFHKEFETFEIEIAPLYDLLIKLPKKERSLASIINMLYEYHGAAHGIHFKIWGDKTPLNTLHLGRILKVFPNAKIIHLVRDGYDVINSYVEAQIYKNHEEAAARWVKSIRKARKISKNLRNVNFIEVRYEDLVLNPSEELSRICSFLNVTFLPQMASSESHAMKMGDVTIRKHHQNVLNPISARSIGKGRRKIKEEGLIIKNPDFYKTLKELKYNA